MNHHRNRKKRRIRKSKSWRKGKSFYAAGLGKHGPYALGTRRIGKRTYLKASIGTKGPLLGVKHSGKRFSKQVMVNLISKRISASVKRKSKKSRKTRKK